MANWYQAEGAPFEVTYAHPSVCRKHQAVLRRRCDLGAVARTFDLTRYYDAVALEVRDGTFVPDLLLTSTAHPERKLYVEIAVTHFLSDEKRASGERIIEVAVESEADVERIRSRHLTETEASFVGFQRTPVPVVDAECICGGRTMHALFVYASGKSIVKQATLSELAAWRTRLGDRVVYARLYETPLADPDGDTYGRGHVDPGRLFYELILEARERGYALRNCYLCRYGGQSWDSFDAKGAFCRIARQSCNSNDAVDCGKWRVKDDLPPSDTDRARSLW